MVEEEEEECGGEEAARVVGVGRCLDVCEREKRGGG
jgi:hypothetical protein